MMATRMLPLIALLAALVAAWPISVCAVDLSGPLSLDDVRELRREGRQTKVIVALAESRRLAFEVDEAAERVLRSLGFRKSMVKSLKALHIDQLPQQPAASDGARSAGAPSDGTEPAARPVDPKQEAAHNAFAARVLRVNAASGVQLRVFPGASVTLVTDAGTANKYFPLIRQIETLIRKNFPPPVGTGPDRRSAYVVLMRNQKVYEQWLKTLFAVNHREGVSEFNAAKLKISLAAGGAMLRGISVMNVQKMGDKIRRIIAFNMGYLYMDRLTEGRAPAALVTGFASMSESNLDGNPEIVLGTIDYSQKHIPSTSGSRWIGLLQQHFAAGRVDSLDQLFAHRYSSLEEIHYAEAWSLIQVLAADPARFARLIEAVRDGQPAVDSVRKIYEVSDQQLYRRWAKLIASAR